LRTSCDAWTYLSRSAAERVERHRDFAFNDDDDDD